MRADICAHIHCTVAIDMANNAKEVDSEGSSWVIHVARAPVKNEMNGSNSKMIENNRTKVSYHNHYLTFLFTTLSTIYLIYIIDL
jgi:hypothetical protein